jgi:DNA repair protein RadC
VSRATRAADASPKRAARTVVADVDAAARLARPVMRLAEQETFVALYLTVRNALIGEPRVVAIGTVTGVEVHPRDVFRGAIAANAAGVVVLHNHPSGDPTPSAEDIELTRRLKACGDLLGIPVVDHVIVTADRCTSIAEMLGGKL